MATRKASSTAKKTVKKSPSTSKPKTTVTTVKAVEAKPAKSVAATTTTVKTAASPAGEKPSALQSISLAALLAEFIGVFVLTAVYIVTKGEPLYLGFTLIAIVLLVGTLSGAHVNPIHTVGAWVTRKIGHLKAVSYLVAQLLGATAAIGLLTAFISGAPKEVSEQTAALGQQAPQLYTIAEIAKGKEWYVFFAELVGATIFSFAVATALREKRDRVAAAMTAGFGLFVAALVASVAASYVSANAVINPVIALAAGAVDWSKINLMAISAYMIAPLLGGVLGFAMSDALRAGRAKDEV